MADNIFILSYNDSLMDGPYDVAAFYTREAAEKVLAEHKFFPDSFGFYKFDRESAHKCSQGNIVCAECDCPIYNEWVENSPDLYPCCDYEHMADDADFTAFYTIKSFEISG